MFPYYYPLILSFPLYVMLKTRGIILKFMHKPQMQQTLKRINPIPSADSAEEDRGGSHDDQPGGQQPTPVKHRVERHPSAVPVHLPREAGRGHDHARQVYGPRLQGSHRAGLKTQGAYGAGQGSTVSGAKRLI